MASDEHPATAPPLFKHEVTDPTEAIFFGCGYCSQVLQKKVELETHIRLTHNGAPYCCIPAPLNPDQAELLHVPHSTLFAEGIPLSEVGRHNIATDCWFAIDGKVYDLTEFLDRHPGGKNSLLAWMGKDATSMFNNVHAGVNIKAYLRPEAYIGELGIKEEMMSEGYWEQLRQARVKELKEELHYFCDEQGAIESASPAWAIAGMQVPMEKVQDRLKNLEERKKAAIAAQDFRLAEDMKQIIEKLQRQAGQAGDVKDASPEDAGILMSEVERHNKVDDCWVVMNGQVVDLTDYLANNKEGRNRILSQAGRDATPLFNKIPNMFPSDGWNKEFLRPEWVLGEVKQDPPLSHHDAKVRELQQELRRLEGPSESARAAAQAAAAAATAAKAAGASSQKGELERFPKLKEIQAGHGALPLFTREEVAKHNTKEAKPYIILHNKVYDMTPLLGNHPGGDDVLMDRAGTDCTVDFELFDHSEKSRVRRDQDMLVGAIVPEECKDMMAASAQGADAEGPAEIDEKAMYVKMKLYDAAIVATGWYLYKSLQHTKPLPKLMYSRALRHLHTIMAVGIFTTLGTAQAAARADARSKKMWIKLHKQTGLLMLFAIMVRMVTRLRSGIPPRFPGFPLVQFVETQSLRVFYALAFALPASGVAYEWFTFWAPNWAREEDEERNEQIAKQSMIMHRKLGKFLNYVWLPFHLGYTTLWHASQGRGVVRKVSPFI